MGNNYVLVVWSASGSGSANLYYHSGSINEGHRQSQTYGSWSNPASFTHENREYSIYCTYQPSAKVKAAIYSDVHTLIASTEEKTVSADGWVTFNFLSPQTLTAGTNYILVAWSDSVGGVIYLRYHSGSSNQGHSQSQSYDSWPDSLESVSHDDYEYSIYCTYALPSEYTCEVEFTNSSNIQSWSQIVWIVDSQFTAPNVTTTLQLWNYYTGSYSTYGDGFLNYTSSSTPGTDETKIQTITTNPTYFRDDSGNWKLKIKGVKTTNLQFRWKGDFIQYQDQYSVYQLNLEEQFTDCDLSQPNVELCIYTRRLSPENLMVDIWSNSTLTWITIIPSLQPNTWNNITVASYLTSETLRIRFWTGTDLEDTTQDSWQIDSTLLQFGSFSSYQLNLEVQWTNINYNEAYKWLCIYGEYINPSSEDLRVDVWNGTSWVTIISQLNYGWNSVDVSSYLVSSTFKIRFRDTQETNDIYQDSWNIDVTMLNVWT
jgi:hypothetical protein